MRGLNELNLGRMVCVLGVMFGFEEFKQGKRVARVLVVDGSVFARMWQHN